MKEPNPQPAIVPDWKWGTAEGSREFDRRVGELLSLREKIEWLEEAETISMALANAREKQKKAASAK